MYTVLHHFGDIDSPVYAYLFALNLPETIVSRNVKLFKILVRMGNTCIVCDLLKMCGVNNIRTCFQSCFIQSPFYKQKHASIVYIVNYFAQTFKLYCFWRQERDDAIFLRLRCRTFTPIYILIVLTIFLEKLSQGNTSV